MILVDKLIKDYPLVNHSLDIFKPFIGGKIPHYRALNNISFEIDKGEVIGVIGANGAGKSTLLKVLSGICMPTHGKIKVNGSSTAILELSTGFQPGATGRENLRRRLFLQGLSSSEIRKLEPEIIEFAELDDYIDQQTRTYSTGMGARLAFSIVTASPAEVLFIDEILAVGDEHFQGKCLKRIKQICSSGRTVIMVSHGMNYVEGLCERAIWLDKGQVKMFDKSHDVVMAYLGNDSKATENLYPKEYGFIENLTITPHQEQYDVLIEVNRLKLANNLHIQVAIHDNKNGILAGLYNTAFDKSRIPEGLGTVQIQMTVPAFPGLSKGLIGAVLTRGSGELPGSTIEDAWGWDNCKQVYFDSKAHETTQSYIYPSLKWSRCS